MTPQTYAPFIAGMIALVVASIGTATAVNAGMYPLALSGLCVFALVVLAMWRLIK